ncbi:MAG: tetratricopeptide repeat protein [Saprospiraceae bacterium]|nr:tetratricopeptide repeat protein [Saprospiraceae bacterium]
MILKIRYSISICLIFCITNFGKAQNQTLADSLKVLVSQSTTIDSVYLKLLVEISFNESDPVVSEEYADSLISKSRGFENTNYQFNGYLQKGNANVEQGNLKEGLSAYFNALEICLESNNKILEGQVYGSIADVYSISEDYDNAIKYYNKSITTLRNTSDKESLSSAIFNAGDTYFYQEKYDSALIYFNEAGEMFNEINFQLGKAYNLGNKGMVYAKQGKHKLAEENLLAGIRILEETENYYPISVYLTSMSDIYHERHDHPKALKFAEESLKIALQYGYKDQISDAYLKLYEFNKHIGDYETALSNYVEYETYKDSIINIESVRDLANQEADFELSQKQLEVDLLEQEKKTQRITIIGTFITFVLSGLMAFFLYRRNRYIKRTSEIIAAEKEKSDKLLLNILPEETADELKEKGFVDARKYNSVTVIFTDFKDFTSYSQDLDPSELVKSIHYYFSKFDEIMDKHNIEKIKTIGDAYMCAGGLHQQGENHAENCVRAAQDIIKVMIETRAHPPEGMNPLNIRIGINTGPVVAGVVGTKKFAYDIWGDVVNVASRMESNSEMGKINISESTYNLVKEKFNCTYRGEFEVKNKGKLKMFYVD